MVHHHCPTLSDGEALSAIKLFYAGNIPYRDEVVIHEWHEYHRIYSKYIVRPMTYELFVVALPNGNVRISRAVPDHPLAKGLNLVGGSVPLAIPNEAKLTKAEFNEWEEKVIDAGYTPIWYTI